MAPSDIVALQAASLVVVPVPLSVQVAVIVLVHGLDSYAVLQPSILFDLQRKSSLGDPNLLHPWETEKKESRSNFEGEQVVTGRQ